ncbi:hypothetical protein [Pantoea anthophila]|uniref:Uncharacterized protein n=1 Tax=Pantoea anthophila TaxID=470931 RepID=A0ABY2ZFQ5_9GAMM|nr:hypothetical protein [Pantoea anthophila]TPV33010.1 hypothetical protein FJW00_01825 [Pantoea anthophila]
MNKKLKTTQKKQTKDSSSSEKEHLTPLKAENGLINHCVNIVRLAYYSLKLKKELSEHAGWLSGISLSDGFKEVINEIAKIFN